MPAVLNLERFVTAQNGVYARVVNELRQGEKRSHWMWFIFPQLAGLGFSATNQMYALASLDEARAYLAHRVVSERLLECTRLVSQVEGRTAKAIFGSPDDLKLRSSMTLFAQASPSQPLFRGVLDKYYGGQSDPPTEELLGRIDKSARD